MARLRDQPRPLGQSQHRGLRLVHVQLNEGKHAQLLTWAGGSPAPHLLLLGSPPPWAPGSTPARATPPVIPGARDQSRAVVWGGRHMGGCGLGLPEAAPPRAGQPSRVCLSPGSPSTTRRGSHPRPISCACVFSAANGNLQQEAWSHGFPQTCDPVTRRATRGLLPAVPFKCTRSRFFAGNSK